MTHIAKGANAPVPTAPLRIAVGGRQVPGAPLVEAAALLLDAAGAVRRDADLVFRGLPAHPSGALRHLGTGDGDGQVAEWLELDLPRVEANVRRILIAGYCDGAAFGAVPGLYAQVVAADGSPVTHYDVTDATTETAFVLGEFYRRDGGWRFRAVGQGYDTGLAGLARDFGGGAAWTAPGPNGRPASGPTPLDGVTKATAGPIPEAGPDGTGKPFPHAPVVTSKAIPGPVPAPVPAGAPPAWGPFLDFEPLVHRGKGATTLTVDLPFPPNSDPVILQARLTDGHFRFLRVLPLGLDDVDAVFNNDLPEHHGRALLVPPPAGGPLKLEVAHSGNWELTVLPLTAARPLTPGTTRGSGREVFLHTGPAAELKVKASDRGSGWFRLHAHRGDGPGALREPAERLVHAWIGKRVREKPRIPEGPLLVVIDKSRHHWEFTVTPLA
ncbi:TerD family protein [Streptomyces sp. NRRL F-5193]|uniref:TerD family protein n=1 Tax=Streptomyces sp. NRRL F-5193 TaxID=1463860 RepID=UPI001F1B8571|nr:TerD family protein [Streptomyces sp. NRRL F-5193]